eukprot:180595-Chlamydomonas_euryale.AAC.4
MRARLERHVRGRTLRGRACALHVADRRGHKWRGQWRLIARDAAATPGSLRALVQGWRPAPGAEGLEACGLWSRAGGLPRALKAMNACGLCSRAGGLPRALKALNAWRLTYDPNATLVWI